MDDKQAAVFNELCLLAQDILSNADGEFKKAESERDAAQRQFGKVSSELESLNIKYAETLRELIDVRKERDNLRGDMAKLTSNYQILAESLQADLSNTKTELNTLRENVAQARRYLAG